MRSGPAWVRAFAAGRRVRQPPTQIAADSGKVDAAIANPAVVDPARVDPLPGQRAWLDIQAAWHRWHVPEAGAGFALRDRPFFVLFDRVRVERLAANGWPGMAANLADAEQLAPASILMRPLYLCARHLAGGDRGAAQAFVDNWLGQHQRSPMQARLASWKKRLGLASDQTVLSVDQVVALVGVLNELLDLDAETWSPAVLADAPAFAGRIGPLVKRCGEHFGAPGDGRGVDKLSAEPLLSQVPIAEDVDDNNEEDPGSALAVDGLAEADAPIVRAYPDYAVFSHRQDETASAARWYQADDHQYLDQLMAIDRRRARQLAHRLQRRLELARHRQWQFDQEAGLIDSRRLARLVRAGSDPRVFRRESEVPVPEAGVALLVDLSGSMRGDRRLSAALAIDLAVHVLEISGVRCEVLGYTTRYGDDNPVERRWQQAGGPKQPGRLNAVRHIVFKGARQPWRRCRRYLGLLLREDFGRENIDGEALHWAAQRLFKLDVSRRILIVLSDGAPFDQATAAANGREFLSEHLRSVVQRLDTLPLHLLAMGTGTDVSRFYRQAVVLERPDAVAETLFAQLGDLLTLPAAERDSR